jgi:hypothetical protein
MKTQESNSQKEHEVGTFAEYKKQLSHQVKAKAAYASAISQNVFASFDKMEAELLHKLPRVI